MRHRHEWTDAVVVNGLRMPLFVTAFLDVTSHLRMTYTVGTYFGLLQSSPRQHGEHMRS